MTHILDLIAVALVTYAAIPATAFPIIYAFRPWRSSLYGWALMMSGVSMALLLDFSLLFWTVGVIPGAHVAQVVVFALIAIASTLMCTVVVKAGRSK